MPRNPVTVIGEKELLRTFDGLTPSLQRNALRTIMRKQGAVLIKHARQNIRARVSRQSRSRGGAGHHPAASGRGLYRSMAQRAYSFPRKGLIGTVVGPAWPEGAHGHLVEFGHRTANGSRTRPIPFQRTAMVTAQSAMNSEGQQKFRDWIKRQQKKGKIRA